jgi:hypothetical protein
LHQFDDTWIEFVKDKDCTSLELWDALVVKFLQPKTWREKLYHDAQAKNKAVDDILS